MKDWINCNLEDVAQVLDNLRKPINNEERKKRIAGKDVSKLFPYYGATGQVGYIDDFLTDGEYILIGEDAAPFFDIGRDVAYKITGKTWVNNHAHILKSNFNNKFLLYFLNSFNYHGYVSGTTRLKLTQGSLKTIPCTLPPLPIQRAIVSKIEELFSSLDQGIADLKKAQEQLKIYRQAVLKKAFDGDWIESQFMVKTVEEMGTILTGNTPSKKDKENYSQRDYNFYKPSDLDKGISIVSSEDFLSKIGYANSRQLPAGSILVTCIGATIGKTALIGKEGSFNQQINAIIPNDNVLPKFLYYQAISKDFQEQIKTKASSTTLPILNKSKFSKLEMNFCSSNEQQQIVKQIESRLSVCDEVEQTISENLKKAEALRQSILKKAFEGKLLTAEEIQKCEQEPDYEPASVLLERIKKKKK